MRSAKVWRITRDYINPEREAIGASNETEHEFGIESTGCRTFRLLDDDRTVYFGGIIVTTNGERADYCSEGIAFSPLDEYGAGAGCTEIQYRENGEWVTL